MGQRQKMRESFVASTLPEQTIRTTSGHVIFPALGAGAKALDVSRFATAGD